LGFSSSGSFQGLTLDFLFIQKDIGLDMIHRKQARQISVAINSLITQKRFKVLKGVVYHPSINGITAKAGREVDEAIIKKCVHRRVPIIQKLQMTEGGYNLPLESMP
jgi:hypothetical protein